MIRFVLNVLLVGASLLFLTAGTTKPVLAVSSPLLWNTFLGSTGTDVGYSVKEDSNGNIYVAGFSSVGWGTPVRAYTGGNDGLVMKFSSDGTLLWSTFLGGAGADPLYGIEVDSSGNIYVVGGSNATWGAPLNAYVGGIDIYIAKLDRSGNLLWNTFLGGVSAEQATGCVLTSSSGLVITGISNGTWGTPVRAYSGGIDNYVAKIDLDGNMLWNTFLGGSGSDSAYNGVVLDTDGNMYINSRSNATWGTPIRAYTPGNYDIFVAKLNSSGVLIWNTFLGGEGSDSYVYGLDDMDIDENSNIFVAGFSTATWETPILPYIGGIDVFVAKLTSDGSLVWNTFLGGSGTDYADGLSLGDDNIIITVDSTTTWGSPLSPYTASADICIVKLRTDGTLISNAFLGGTSLDTPRGVFLSRTGNLFVTGYSSATWGSPLRAYTAAEDAFLLKVDVASPTTTDDTDILWHNSDVIVNLTCTDNAGGIGCANTYYTTDGSTPTTSSTEGTSVTLTTEGEHTIKYFSVDAGGNEETIKTASYTVKIDKTVPTGTVSINGGAALTNTRDTTLSFTATDSMTSVTHVKFSESESFTGASWETYAASKSFTLTSANGLKTVYAKFKDSADNESPTYSDTISLDTTKPVTKITDLGLITDIPDKTPLFYYFTSQTPRIKGTTEALSTVHFEYGEEDYTTTADADGKYEIALPELPRELVELTYYAVDPAGNQGTDRILKLMIGVENFPAELLPQDETTTEAEGTTPTKNELTPTPTETPTDPIKVFGIEITDQNGNPLTETAVYIDGQRYVTDKNGKIYIEKQPTEGMELEVEINGQRIKGTVMGEKIVAEVPAIKANKAVGWYWWVLGAAFIGVSGYSYSQRKR